MKYQTRYYIKYETSDHEYPHLVRGIFKYLDSAMNKVDELKRDRMVTKIVMKVSHGRQTAVKCYVWDRGFEAIYLKYLDIAH